MVYTVVVVIAEVYLGSVMMRGAPNEKHQAPSNLLAQVKVKSQMLHDWVTPKVPVRICI